MPFFKKIASIGTMVILSSILLSFYASAAVYDCRPRQAGDEYIDLSIVFDISSSTSALSPGTTLANANSANAGLTCTFTGPESTENTVYFKNTMSSTVKELLLSSGVEITQRYLIGGGDALTITNPSVPDMNLGIYAGNGAAPATITLATIYGFSVKKGTQNLKPFDTGRFQLGMHVDYQGRNIGTPMFMRIKGDLTLLCPTPAVSINASNGGSINFDTVSPQQMNAGGEVTRSFNLNMAVAEDCETGLNISVRFEPNNNTILGNKYLDMGNGLQTVLNNYSTDIDYNQNYPIGEILPFAPLNIPYTATLTKIPGDTITSGPFSKTIRVVVSY